MTDFYQQAWTNRTTLHEGGFYPEEQPDPSVQSSFQAVLFQKNEDAYGSTTIRSCFDIDKATGIGRAATHGFVTYVDFQALIQHTCPTTVRAQVAEIQDLQLTGPSRMAQLKLLTGIIAIAAAGWVLSLAGDVEAALLSALGAGLVAALIVWFAGATFIKTRTPQKSGGVQAGERHLQRAINALEQTQTTAAPEAL